MVKAVLSENVKKELLKNPEIEFVEIDDVVSVNSDQNDPYISEVTTWGFEQINAMQSQQLFMGDGVPVALFDSGIDVDHPDLSFVEGVSFVEGTTFNDDYGHGTHVAGTIAAKNNNIGIIGVAPLVDLYIVKVLDKNGNGNLSNVVEALSWVLDRNIRVVSMSLGTSNESKSLKKAFKNAEKQGLIIVSSAGNLGSSETDSNITYPAAFDSVISVGAIDEKKKIASFSSVGKELDYVAPGVGILSTFNNGGYSIQSGTSMAAPYITGIIALILEKDPTLSKNSVIKILNQSSIPLGDKFYYGNGLVDSYKAVNY